VTTFASDVLRLHMGHFTMPEGGRIPAGQLVVVSAFLIRHPRGLFLFDTGIGEGHAEAEARYRPVRRSLDAELARVGASASEVRLVANCHLHFDHSGGNFRFAGVPIFAQAREHAAAQAPDYTLPDRVIDFAGARFELLDGEAEPLDGLRIIPTPGHTDGHQSLVVETKQGRIVLAGQAMNETSDYARAHYASALARERGGPAPGPARMDRFAALDPWRVYFAHDLAIWERGA